MQSLIHADIFFFITSVAVIIVTLLMAVALVYAIKILRDVKHVTTEVKAQSRVWLSDIDEMRRFFKSEGVRFAGLIGSIFRFIGNKRKRKKKSEERAEKSGGEQA
jgi:hypothetical protein